MGAQNRIIVKGSEQLLKRHKEEIAEEFGVHASQPNQGDVTPRLMENVENKHTKDVKTNEDM